ncbi:hypothetical protein [Megasphaera elsdenii]|uniref:hypothetical protein n=1 Tax=Megasphaera elsdenii TaxID=907 RepID=UPI0026DD8753|nr:hypothetical protein [Megasphaera elsdenii]
MKKGISFVKDNFFIIAEIIVFIMIVYALSFVPDELVEKFSEPTSFLDILPSMIVSCCGKIGIWLIASVIIFKSIRIFNARLMLNQGNRYHQSCYLWYWFCAHILGIEKCNLILVPIYLQFELVINDVFEEYPFDEKRFPTRSQEKIAVKKLVPEITGVNDSEVNLVLEDTYPINLEQIPEEKRSFFTIKISRNHPDNIGKRYYSPQFIEEIQTEVRKLTDSVTVNVFATTNPVNTRYIAQNAFQLANRGNVRCLYVYQQSSVGNRNFEPKGHRIYG